ncbi:peroxisomal biogenesis factor 19-like [Macrosteles quadrilineatus]|uniref:peroxisomal biogenesis factor 19-like n=1 Tax=Macrosteles quadrilineatus TaxID=74068 RepID=UPI0023E1B24C|nr:peroxisomal biogenesis factor 19-like [Macrosteles quadrilineatus]
MAESNDSENQALAAEVQQPEEDMDSLLDSALDDFSKVSLETSTPAVKPEETAVSQEAETESMWANMLKEAMQADPSMKEMFGEGGPTENDFFQDFSKIAEAAVKAIEGDSSSNFADIVSETLKSLQDNSELSRNQFGDPEQMASLFQDMGLNSEALGQDGSVEDIPPFLQNIMQQFLSKDVLYPSIKDFVDRYPAWLEANKESLTQAQFDNYTKQLELMKKVVEEFEAESEEDSAEVKKQRFQRIMGLLQQMQGLGQPPMELIQGDSDSPLDETNLPSLPPGLDPQQCCLM